MKYQVRITEGAYGEYFTYEHATYLDIEMAYDVAFELRGMGSSAFVTEVED